MNWESILRIWLWGWGVYTILRLLLWCGLESNTPHLSFFRKWFWFVIRDEYLKRSMKGLAVIGYPMSIYINLDPTPKQKFIEQGYRVFKLDLVQQVNFISDKLIQSWNEAHKSIEERMEDYFKACEEYHEKHKDDKLYQQGFDENIRNDLRETMSKIKQKKNEN